MQSRSNRKGKVINLQVKDVVFELSLVQRSAQRILVVTATFFGELGVNKSACNSRRAISPPTHPELVRFARLDFPLRFGVFLPDKSFSSW